MQPAFHLSWLASFLPAVVLFLLLAAVVTGMVVLLRRRMSPPGGSSPPLPVTMAMAPAFSTADTKEARLDILRRLARKEIDKARAEQELMCLGEPAMEIPNPLPPSPPRAAGGCLRSGLMGLGCLVVAWALFLLVLALVGIGLGVFEGMAHQDRHGVSAMPSPSSPPPVVSGRPTQEASK